MKVDTIDRFYNGWVVGKFQPSIVETSDVSVGILQCPAGHIADGHFHKLHTEYNIIIKGLAQIGERTFTSGDIFIYEPYDRADVKYLEDTTLLVVKSPSVKDDKYV